MNQQLIVRGAGFTTTPIIDVREMEAMNDNDDGV